ncbi:hypothetical protein STEG23_020499, partial [Scotinomys teguina]
RFGKHMFICETSPPFSQHLLVLCKQSSSAPQIWGTRDFHSCQCLFSLFALVNVVFGKCSLSFSPPNVPSALGQRILLEISMDFLVTGSWPVPCLQSSDIVKVPVVTKQDASECRQGLKREATYERPYFSKTKLCWKASLPPVLTVYVF